MFIYAYRILHNGQLWSSTKIYSNATYTTTMLVVKETKREEEIVVFVLNSPSGEPQLLHLRINKHAGELIVAIWRKRTMRMEGWWLGGGRWLQKDRSERTGAWSSPEVSWSLRRFSVALFLWSICASGTSALGCSRGEPKERSGSLGFHLHSGPGLFSSQSHYIEDPVRTK